jgi:hypothetical protein
LKQTILLEFTDTPCGTSFMDAISFNNVDDLYTTQMRGLAPAGSLTRFSTQALEYPPPEKNKHSSVSLSLETDVAVAIISLGHIL